MARGRDDAGGSLFGAWVAAIAVLAFGVGMWLIVAFLHSSVSGDLFAPVEDGRWVDAPMMVLLALFTFVGLAAVGGAIFLIWLLVSTAWEARRPRQ
ncbi:hypothetical protein ACI3KY_15595 [Microbacterium sp. ZW T2_14]|uniref:hypothetical protein n=1 Tax=Microbacterium sp. ZW T2_14 TaxID=3378079 RepID=UPI003854E596